MLDFLKKFFKRCEHNWVFVKMQRFNQWADNPNNEDEEIVSSKEYSLQRCDKCRKSKYRKL